jgi:hypothetical protein
MLPGLLENQNALLLAALRNGGSFQLDFTLFRPKLGAFVSPLKLPVMKALFILLLSASFSAFTFGQIDFAPVGATWVSYYSCSGWNYPPPPSYYTSFTVTKDTIIQGNYCTRLPYGEWPCSWNDEIWVYQKGKKIFRYDIESESFKLVIDFGKQVGESWKVEVCEDMFGTDTITMTVLESDGIYRLISAKGGYMDNMNLELPVYEGFGGIYYNKRLVITSEFFLHADPYCYGQLICYQDPELGVIYGSGDSCFTASEEAARQQFSMNISPNPATAQATLDYQLPPGTPAEVRIFNSPGRQVEVIPVTRTSGSLTLPDYPPGLYLVALAVEGQVVRMERWVRF